MCAPFAPGALQILADGLSLSDARRERAHHLSGQGGSSGSVPRSAPLQRASAEIPGERTVDAPVRRWQLHDSSKLLEINKAKLRMFERITLLQDPDAPKLSEENLKEQADLEAAAKAAREEGKP